MGVAAWIRRRTFSPTTPAPSRRGGKRTCQSPSTWRRAATDPGMYASAPERILKAIGEPQVVDTAKDPRLGRIFLNRTIRIYPAFSEFYGMEETIERIVGFFRHAAQGLEERKQILYLLGPVGGGKSSLAERLKALMEAEPIYVLKAGDDLSPVFESPLGLFDPERHGAEAGGPLRHPAPAPHRADEPLVPEAPRRVRRRPLEVPGGEAQPLAPAPDRGRQDRAGRREQPGHLLARRQGGHPQAGDVRAERSGRLQLLRRPEPRQPGHPRIRRDVQGADQDAAPPAHRDAGGQLHRHREHRRHPLPGHHHGPLQRGGVAELPQQQEQRSLHRPHLRHQGALLPAGDGGAAHLRQAGARLGARGGALRPGDARDAGALHRALAPEAARELQPLRQDAGL